MKKARNFSMFMLKVADKIPDKVVDIILVIGTASGSLLLASSVSGYVLPALDNFSKSLGLRSFGVALLAGALGIIWAGIYFIVEVHRMKAFRRTRDTLQTALNETVEQDSGIGYGEIAEWVRNRKEGDKTDDAVMEIDKSLRVVKVSKDTIFTTTEAISAAVANSSERAITETAEEHTKRLRQSIRTPLFATVVSGIATSRLSIVCLSLLACFVAEWMAYTIEFVELTNSTRYWFYGIAGVAALDYVLVKVRHLTRAYGNHPVELMEVAAEVSKHTDMDGGPGSGTHFYVDDLPHKSVPRETSPNVQGDVV
ncbi:hypothetical protein [Thalassospira sp. CH_XMU1420-2]|uniref:hypothetical protein n=1 Tax=Thalassospira sp. CH_XMU1420-2 TaxID=3107769 RepID=UPI00300A1DD2|tara:strand:+ start:556 stop:1488 length:933 start_codon:yes stop_codon:yes gene_type:complete